MDIIVALVVGLFAGALAGMFVKGRGFGLIGDTLVGLVGGVIGSALFNLLGIYAGGNILGSILVSFVGAVILLIIVKTLVIERA